MEQNTAQHTLTFSKGITNIPSDLLCPDDTLSSAEGLILSDGEYKAMQAPVKDMTLDSGDTLLFVHELNSGKKNFITKVSTGGFSWRDSAGKHTVDGFSEDVLSVVSVGNTLIIQTSESLYYFLWKYDDITNKFIYKNLGSKLPEPHMSFSLRTSADDDTGEVYDEDTAEMDLYFKYHSTVKSSQDAMAIGDFSGMLDGESITNKDAFDNLVIGLYSKNKNLIKKRKCGFCNPFFVRYAFELSDGSFAMISNPILLLPSVTRNSYLVDYKQGKKRLMNTRYARLVFTNDAIDGDWKDIVKNLCVFVSPEIDVYDTADTLFKKIAQKEIAYDIVTDMYSGLSVYGIDAYRVFSEKTNLIEKLSEVSIFFKIFDISAFTANEEYTDIAKYTDPERFLNLTTQDRLDADDYHSHCPMFTNNIATFNRRLNLYGVKRGFFQGFSDFHTLKYSRTNHPRTCIVVYIRTNDGIKTVSTGWVENRAWPGVWFFYPDTRAYKAQFFYYNAATYLSKEVELKEHPGLNGAYFIEDIPKDSLYQPEEKQWYKDLPTPITTPESLPNYLIQSEADNPFTFLASGYVRVGQGTILGIAGLTTALNQDAYMVATTLAFTTQGIWALSINGEGQYSGVNPPFSREVCNNPASITMTDNAVFFTSEKGLMCVTGTRETSVICVSDALRNSDFVDFCRTCRIAYDYKESLLLLYQPGQSRCFIYNIKSNAWTYDDSLFLSGVQGSRLVDGAPAFLTTVVDYPDTLIQTDEGDIFSLLKRPNRDADNGTTYSGTLVSRPCKLDGSQVLKSLRQLKLLYDIDGSVTDAIKNGKITLTIEGSNDCKNWHTLTSLRSKPFKFFRFSITFRDLHATDTFTGLTLITQKRYTEKLI